MKLNYDMFYRKYGILNANKLGRPKLISGIVIDLPQNSVYHHIEPDGEIVGMPPESEYARNKQHQIGVLFQHKFTRLNTQTKLPDGVTALKRHSLFPIENEFFQTNPRYKNLRRNANLSAEKNNLIIEDYSILPQTVVYRETQRLFWHKWKNLNLAMIDNINAFAARSTRQHFIEITVPEFVPPLSVWNMIDKDYGQPAKLEGVQIRQELWKRFSRYDMLCIMDLWVWLGTYRQKSNLAQLTEVARNRTNIIFRAGGNYTVISLGQLDSWLMKPDNNSPEARMPSNVAKYRLLGLMVSLNKNRHTVLTEGEAEALIDDDVIDAEDLKDLEAAEKPTTDISEVFGGVAPVVRRLDIDLDRTKNSTADDVKIEIKTQALTPQDQVQVKADDFGTVNPADPSITNDEQLMVDLSDDEILKDLEQLEYTYKQREIDETYGTDYEAYKPPSTDPEDAIYDAATRVAGKALLSEAELRRLVKKSANYKSIANPYGGEGTFAEAIQIQPEDLVIGEKTPLAESITGVIDESMLSSSLGRMNAQYIDKVFNKDIGQVFLSLQQAGIIVEDYTVEKVDNYTDSYDIHKVRILPVRGQASTLNIRIPRIKPDGSFKAGGVRYLARSQRGDLPIRKTAANKVAMTSYFSKMFVTRSERAVFNYGLWITRKIIELGWSQDEIVTDLALADVSSRTFTGARTYSAIATRISSFKSKGYIFSFDHSKLYDLFGTVPKLPITAVAYSLANPQDRIYITQGNMLVRLNGGKEEEIGTMEDWLGLDLTTAPLDIAEMKIFGKPVPIGIILAQHTGLGSLMKTLGTQYRQVPKGASLKLQPYEYAIRFEDETLILDRRDRLSMLVLGGFNRYHQHIKQHSRYAFDKRDVYGVIFENVGVGSRKTRDVDFMFKMWVDHITRDILVEMGMPTDLFNLFIEACKMLVNDAYNEEIDVAFMRDKGYERVAGMLYEEIINSVKAFNNKPNSLNSSVQVNPLAVWMRIQTDQAVIAIDESNPIQSLKDLEVVVFRGAGGRSSTSMTAPTRVFHPNAMGITSEATVDNGDVGTIAFTSADPNYTSVRGTTRRLDSLNGNAAKIVSTSMLLASGSDMDD